MHEVEIVRRVRRLKPPSYEQLDVLGGECVSVRSGATAACVNDGLLDRDPNPCSSSMSHMSYPHSPTNSRSLFSADRKAAL